MEKKSNQGILVLIVLLIICIIGLVFYILVDKDIIKLNNITVEDEQVEKNNSKDDTKEKNTDIVIDPENANIKYLFDIAHPSSIGIPLDIFRDGGYKVSEMSEEHKIRLLSKQWTTLIEVSYYDNQSLYFLYEDTLKDIYERTFGPDTYHQVNQITDGCFTLTYDVANKRYSYVGDAGCGGTSAFSVFEKIISATRYSDRIEIVSAAVYLDGMSQQMYKDYNKTTSLGGLLIDENTTYNREERENTYNKYIEDNKDNLEQYTYTFTRNEDGFYYLISVERTKS